MMVVAYDVANDRRRVRLHQVLLGYGVAVQESVFECDLSDRQIAHLKRDVARVIRPRMDRVRFYSLCADCARLTEDETGTPVSPTPAVVVV